MMRRGLTHPVIHTNAVEVAEVPGRFREVGGIKELHANPKLGELATLF